MKPKKKWRDRRDAKRIKMPAMMRLLTYISNRQDSDVYINRKIDVTELVKYMKKKKEKDNSITYFHAFAIALAKVVYNRPKLNRYIINHQCYQRSGAQRTLVSHI